MNEIIANLLAAASGARPKYFESSGWLENKSPVELAQIVDAHERHYGRRLQEFVKLLGEPTTSEKTHREEISKWYPEAIRAACWTKDQKILCLALEQQDRESPVSVLLRCLTAEEIAALSE